MKRLKCLANPTNDVQALPDLCKCLHAQRRTTRTLLNRSMRFDGIIGGTAFFRLELRVMVPTMTRITRTDAEEIRIESTTGKPEQGTD